MVDFVKDILLKYKLLILFILILSFIGSCHCIKPTFLDITKMFASKKDNTHGVK